MLRRVRDCRRYYYYYYWQEPGDLICLLVAVFVVVVFVLYWASKKKTHFVFAKLANLWQILIHFGIQHNSDFQLLNACVILQIVSFWNYFTA